MKYFSIDYDQARETFLKFSEKEKLALHSYSLNNQKANNLLAMDFAVYRSEKNTGKKVFVVSSGVHGIEGFFGSALQSFCLDNFKFLKEYNCDIILIHAVNPFGFEKMRRVNEENIDINRNFIDFTQPLPQNPNYAGYDLFFMPEIWGSNEHLIMQKKLGALITERGIQQAQEDISQGQYTHPQGLFYGGKKPTWSRLSLEKFSREFLSKYLHIVCLDLHTGLGSYGEPCLIYDTLKHDKGYAHANIWHKGKIFRTDESSPSARINGSLGNIIPLTRGITVSLTLEIGTKPAMEVFEAMLAENWLFRTKLSFDENKAQEIKKIFKDSFYPSDAYWQQSAIEKGYKIIQDSLKGLKRV